ncbi:4Fe-4S dicluster domain-containing protein [Desulfovibrio sp. OttesenSCG-928-F07]|nr:4Fe-4S dicluster domain-containing protein [Desulfovibrio sp. OttesenSCG-928-F07]
METVNLGKGDADFTRQVESESGQNVSKCYQCGNCTAGCPMSFTYDYSVSRIMRLIQLGQKEKVLASRAIWMCATCEACTTHCPNNIEVAKVLDVCRSISRREGYKGVRNVRLFTDSFLQSVRWHGRSHELGLMAVYKMRSFRYFDDLDLAPGMLSRGKLPILPHRIKGAAEVAAIFKRFENGEHLKGGSK